MTLTRGIETQSTGANAAPIDPAKRRFPATEEEPEKSGRIRTRERDSRHDRHHDHDYYRRRHERRDYERHERRKHSPGDRHMSRDSYYKTRGPTDDRDNSKHEWQEHSVNPDTARKSSESPVRNNNV